MDSLKPANIIRAIKGLQCIQRATIKHEENSKALKITIKALKEIRNNEGAVCNNFELCHHDACKSSYSSWQIANQALEDIHES